MAKQDEGEKGGREMASEGGGADLKLGTESPAKAGKSLPPSPSTPPAPARSSEKARAGGCRMAEVSMLLLLVEEDIGERMRRDVTRRKPSGGNSKWHVTHAWINRARVTRAQTRTGWGMRERQRDGQLPRREAKRGRRLVKVDEFDRPDESRGVSRRRGGGTAEASRRDDEACDYYCTYSQ